MNTTQSARELPGRHWVSIAVVVGCVLVLVAILLPAVHNARQAARRTQSKNALKQLGLAIHNYHDVHSMLPLGGDIDAIGIVKHGWCTRLVPYLEASDLYSRINMNLPWDHPVQINLFRGGPWGLVIPGVDETHSRDGFGLLHYTANPNALHRNHCITLDDMTTGTANNWIFGEASGNYEPWGYPINWRSLKTPLNSGPDGYGVWPDGGQICLADGSVRFYSNDADTALLKSLANAPPIATSAQTAKPEHRKESEFTATRRIWFEADIEVNWKGNPGTEILFDENDKPFLADIHCNDDGEVVPIWNVGRTKRIDLQGVLDNFPEIRVLNVHVVNDENAAIIAQFPDLEYLQAWKFELTEKGQTILDAHSKLKTIVHR